MKAITCSQCGALVTQFSIRDKFADCNYCGAKILLEENKERIIEISKKEADMLPKLDPAERERLFKTMVEQNNDYKGHKETADTFRILLVIGLIAFAVIAPILITSYFKSKRGKAVIRIKSNSPRLRRLRHPKLSIKIQNICRI